MRYIPNVLSVTRIILSVCLLLAMPFSVLFWFIYALGGLSDIADGYLARKMNTASKTGAVLDSLGDLVFVAVMGFLVLSYIKIPLWAFIWIGGITIVKLLSILVGYIKFHAFVALHTYSNKGVGLLLFVGFPYYVVFSNDRVLVFLLGAAVLAAVEELLIVMRMKKLQRDIRGIFCGNKAFAD